MSEEIKNGIASLESQVDYWWLTPGPLAQVADFASILLQYSQHPIVMGTTEESVQQGALLHLTPGVKQSVEEGAAIARSIIEGKAAGSIPVSQSSGFDFAVNLATAIKHDIAIPADLLELAEGHIYR